ncbi:MAG: lipid kinase [Bacteroidaceae bacterium]|nr:lipid kinase [Bacteroidaceae bacterium]
MDNLQPRITPAHQQTGDATPTGSRWAIIYCPKQGVRRSQQRWERIQALLTERHVSYDFVQSESPESVERLAHMMCQQAYDTLIVVGGDSALNRAVNGLLATGDEARNRIALGVIPNGRGNDFAGYWGFDESRDEQTIDWLIARRLRKVDVGYLRTADGQRRHFLNCVNIGLVANIMKLKYKTRRIFGLSSLTYLASMLLLLFQRLETHMHLRINEETIDRRIMTVCVGSCHGYGQTPNAVPYNGMLDASVVSHPEVRQLLEGMWMLFTGQFLNHKSVKAYRTSRRIHFADIHGATVSTDGMAIPVSSPFDIGIHPEHISFIIPS